MSGSPVDHVGGEPSTLLRQRWAAIADAAPPNVLEGLLRLVDSLPLSQTPQAPSHADLGVAEPALAAILAFSRSLLAELGNQAVPQEAVATAAAAAAATFGPAAGSAQETGAVLTVSEAGPEAAEEGRILHIRVTQAVSGAVLVEDDVPASMSVKELRGHLATDRSREITQGRFKLLAHGQVLDDNVQLGDLAPADVLEVQLIRLPAPRLEPVEDDTQFANVRQVKIVLVGDARVGKTSMLRAFMGHDFVDRYFPTIGVEFALKLVRVDGRVNIRAQVWDIGGEAHFRAINPFYYRNSAAVLIVFDVTNRSSFEHVQNWVEQVCPHLDEQAVLALAGNKVDCPAADRVVSEAEAATLATSLGISYSEHAATIAQISPIEHLLLETLTRIQLD